jgi:23S rRNA (cytosine1962-C5)-methyltransferase
MSNTTSLLRLRVSPVAESNLRAGHPWLFAGSIRAQNREGQLGELAAIYDRKDEFLAIGLFDPESPIRVRVLHAGKARKLDEAWWLARLQQSLTRREGLFDDQTSGHRLIHGESDGWPGLVLDRYDTTFVLKLYTAAWLPRLGEVEKLVRGRLNPAQLVLRLSRNIQPIARDRFGLEEGHLAAGIPPGVGMMSDGADASAPRNPSSPSLPLSEQSKVTFLETGLRFEADVVKGQKTGFFLDQRENRRRVEALAAGRDALNAFSFSGGFSLYAARGGATSVTDLDISPHALESAQRNFDLNRKDAAVARCRHERIRADAFDWLEQNTARQFDLIVLDPPSLAKRETERTGAIQSYARLAGNGIRALRRDGILVAASCSAHVSAEEFFEVMRGATAKSGRAFAELGTTGHPPDHPATFQEAEYLKCIYLRG